MTIIHHLHQLATSAGEPGVPAFTWTPPHHRNCTTVAQRTRRSSQRYRPGPLTPHIPIQSNIHRRRPNKPDAQKNDAQKPKGSVAIVQRCLNMTKSPKCCQITQNTPQMSTAQWLLCSTRGTCPYLDRCFAIVTDLCILMLFSTTAAC